ncbi:MAG: hypothetical protein R2867_23505 [Caldilineaceae bacterium]
MTYFSAGRNLTLRGAVEPYWVEEHRSNGMRASATPPGGAYLSAGSADSGVGGGIATADSPAPGAGRSRSAVRALSRGVLGHGGPASFAGADHVTALP